MANICNNTLAAFSTDQRNLNAIEEYFRNYDFCDIDRKEESIEVNFESKWTFPESDMEDLYHSIPNKEDIYIRCLSVEYGNLYHALWICDEDNWREV